MEQDSKPHCFHRLSMGMSQTSFPTYYESERFLALIRTQACRTNALDSCNTLALTFCFKCLFYRGICGSTKGNTNVCVLKYVVDNCSCLLDTFQEQ